MKFSLLLPVDKIAFFKIESWKLGAHLIKSMMPAIERGVFRLWARSQFMARRFAPAEEGVYWCREAGDTRGWW